MINRKELFLKNLILGYEFDRYVIEHPKFAESIPDNAYIVLYPEYDTQLGEENLRIAELQKAEDQPLVIVRIKKLAPVRKSRVVSPKVEIVKA